MGEIKSTLELIMEKTKGLTVTEEEKRAFERQELEKKFRGLFQKGLDGFLQPGDIAKELENLDKDKRAVARDILVNLCLGAMDPEGDNEILYKMLSDALHADPAAFKKRLESYREKIEEDRGQAVKRLTEALGKRGIRGSAVIANEHADPEWLHRLADLKKECREGLSSIPIRENP